MNLLTRVSEYLLVNPDKMKELKVYDGYVNMDSDVYISPKLLANTTVEELKLCESKILLYFANLIKLLENVKCTNDNDIRWKMAKNYFSFPEPKGVALGTSIGSMDGKGLSGKTAEEALLKLKEIVDTGLTDPYIFELLSVVQENIGVDRISDMIVNVIYDDLLTYTENIMKKLNITELEEYKYKSKVYNIKFRENGRPLILVPEEILGEIPSCASYADVELVIEENKKAREELFKMFGEAATLSESMKKNDIYAFMKENNLFLTTLEKVKNKEISSYDFEEDINGIHLPIERMKEVYLKHSSELLKPLNNALSLYEIVGLLISQFKFIIESKGLNEELYKETITKTGLKKKVPRSEITSHRLFIAVLESLSSIYDVDYTYEPKSGNGEVDFRFIRGHEIVLVEFKHNYHSKLVHGYNTQLTTYMKREKSKQAYFVIVKVVNNKAIDDFDNSIPTRDGNKKVIVVDGLLKEPPSKLKE